MARFPSFAEVSKDHRHHSATAVVLNGARLSGKETEEFWRDLLINYSTRDDLRNASKRRVSEELLLVLRKLYNDPGKPGWQQQELDKIRSGLRRRCPACATRR